jgi:hypothetical protein
MRKAILLAIIISSCILIYCSIHKSAIPEGFQGGEKPYRVAVITAIFGNYDTVKEHPIRLSEKVDWYCFTDNKNLKSNFWNVIYTPYHIQNDDGSLNGNINSFDSITDQKVKNMMAAKYYKAKTHEIDILKGYDYFIWVDGSIFLRDSFLEEVFKLFDRGYGLISFKHSKRTTLEDEIEESRLLKKYTSQPLEDQYKRYKNEGYNNDVELFENTIMIRKNTRENAKLFNLWWVENVTMSYQDQLSYPYCLWKLNMYPDYVIKENVFNNEKFSYVNYDLLKNH